MDRSDIVARDAEPRTEREAAAARRGFDRDPTEQEQEHQGAHSDSTPGRPLPSAARSDDVAARSAFDGDPTEEDPEHQGAHSDSAPPAPRA